MAELLPLDILEFLAHFFVLLTCLNLMPGREDRGVLSGSVLLIHQNEGIKRVWQFHSRRKLLSARFGHDVLANFAATLMLPEQNLSSARAVDHSSLPPEKCTAPRACARGVPLRIAGQEGHAASDRREADELFVGAWSDFASTGGFARFLNVILPLSQTT